MTMRAVVCLLVVVCAAATPVSTIPTPSAVEVVSALFKALDIPADATTCVNDVGGMTSQLRNFVTDVDQQQYKTAVGDLAHAMTALSTAVSGCDVTGLRTKVDAIASAIKFANVSVAVFDGTVKAIVGASDLWNAMSGLATAIKSDNPSSIGAAISNMLSQWTAVVGGCSNSKACTIVDGILRILAVTADDITPCENALFPAVANLTAASSSFKSQSYKAALTEFASGLDAIAQAIDDDSCGLKPFADVLVSVVPQLSSAVVKIEGSNAVHIIVGSADLYDTLYQATLDVENGDLAGFGMQMGRLVQQLQASGCSTPACSVLQALLATMQIEATDFQACSQDADAAWGDITAAAQEFSSHVWAESVENLAAGLGKLGSAVQDCGVPDVANVIEQAAGKLGDGAIAQDIGNAVAVLVQGADVSVDLSQSVADFTAKSWPSFGNDLLNLAGLMNSSKCTTMVCKVVEGLLDVTGTAFHDLVACEQDLQAAEAAFVAGAQSFAAKDIAQGVQHFAGGLNTIAKSVSDCGLQAELGFIEQEANVLGFGNVSIIGDIGSVIVHGADFYEELYAAFQALESHDYRSAGQELGQVMNTLSQWTQGHVCTSDFCYVVVGILDFMGDVEGSVKECEADFKEAWGNFTAGFESFADSHHNIIFHFSQDQAAIKAGVADIGHAFGMVAQGVSDCHLQEFATLLEDLAVKLGIAPEVSWIEEVLHILIEGVDIEREVDNACTDYASGNWVGFGYNLARLVKTLL